MVIFRLLEIVSFPIQHSDVPIRSGNFPLKNGDYPSCTRVESVSTIGNPSPVLHPLGRQGPRFGSSFAERWWFGAICCWNVVRFNGKLWSLTRKFPLIEPWFLFFPSVSGNLGGTNHNVVKQQVHTISYNFAWLGVVWCGFRTKSKLSKQHKRNCMVDNLVPGDWTVGTWGCPIFHTVSAEQKGSPGYIWLLCLYYRCVPWVETAINRKKLRRLWEHASLRQLNPRNLELLWHSWLYTRKAGSKSVVVMPKLNLSHTRSLPIRL